jgi:hypothetical protein
MAKLFYGTPETLVAGELYVVNFKGHVYDVVVNDGTPGSGNGHRVVYKGLKKNFHVALLGTRPDSKQKLHY